jgi:hypothetical protein
MTIPRKYAYRANLYTNHELRRVCTSVLWNPAPTHLISWSPNHIQCFHDLSWQQPLRTDNPLPPTIQGCWVLISSLTILLAVLPVIYTSQVSDVLLMTWASHCSSIWVNKEWFFKVFMASDLFSACEAQLFVSYNTASSSRFPIATIQFLVSTHAWLNSDSSIGAHASKDCAA